VAILLFWGLSLSSLRAVPVLMEDESWQASPAYKLATQGVYGSDMFTGFFGMERHYYGFMPLYPLMLAGAFRALGAGLFQARLVSVTLALLTLALTFALGRRLFGGRTGALAVLILLLARLAPTNYNHLTGIPLLDQARIVRYDIAVPVFGLASLYTWLKAEADPCAWRYLLSGGLAGLAGLSHVYGAFWLPALLLLTFLNRAPHTVHDASRSKLHARLAWLLLGSILPWLPWLAYIATGFSDYVNQNRNYADRFDLLWPGFYFHNLATEFQRYDLGVRSAGRAALWWLGTWSGLAGLAAALAALARRAWRGDRPGRAVIIPLAVIEFLFALLLALKTPGYALTLWPLVALAGGWGVARLWEPGPGARSSGSDPGCYTVNGVASGSTSSHTVHGVVPAFPDRPGDGAMLLSFIIPAPSTRLGVWVRLGLLAIALAVGIEGGWRIAGLLAAGPRTTPYETYMAEVAAYIPPGARVLGLQNYWLGLRRTGYRTLLLPFILADPRYTLRPVAVDQTLEALAPDVVLIDVRMGSYLDEIGRPDHPDHAKWVAFWGFMDRHRARLAAQVDDAGYGPMRVYYLNGR